MAQMIPIGRALFLFRDDTGGSASKLLISTHGGYYARPELGKQTGAARMVPGLGGWIEVPQWTRLMFYGPHKQSLKDPGIDKVVSGTLNYLEQKLPGDKVRNYGLSKYQGDDTGESYDTIKGDIDRNRTTIGMRNAALASGDQIAMDQVAKYCPNPFPEFDVLTVRNRRMTFSVTLNEVLELLDTSGNRYPEIHCIFCRSRIVGPDKSHDARQNP